MTPSLGLDGRVAIVTGGSRGIGAATVRALAAAGAKVAFCHVGDEERAKRVTEELNVSGHSAYAAECDVSDEASVANFVGEVARRLGHADILVNNAGISGQALFESITPAAFDRMIGVHLRGTFLMTSACYPAMKAKRHGRIINTSSQLAFKGATGLVHYTAAKAAILGFTRALAREAAPFGILVNAVAPGPVDTEMLQGMSEDWKAAKRAELPLGRFGTPEEIAPTIVFLASGGAGYYVGQTLGPNGGDVM